MMVKDPTKELLEFPQEISDIYKFERGTAFA
jgi:hypothetical protein